MTTDNQDTSNKASSLMNCDNLVAMYDNNEPFNDPWYAVLLQGDGMPGWLDYAKQVAGNVGYDCAVVTYNLLTFGAAVDHTEMFVLMLNPYVRYDTKWLTPRLPNRKSIYEALIDAPEYPCDEELTPEDLYICQRLPNRDSTVNSEGRLFYRPPSGECLSARAIESGATILHPWKPRPLVQEEIDLLFKSCLLHWLYNIANQYRIVHPASPGRYAGEYVLTDIPTVYLMAVEDTYKPSPEFLQPIVEEKVTVPCLESSALAQLLDQPSSAAVSQ